MSGAPEAGRAGSPNVNSSSSSSSGPHSPPGPPGSPEAAAHFLAALFAPSDLFVIKPIESWLDPTTGRQHTRSLFRSFAYRRGGTSAPDIAPDGTSRGTLWTPTPAPQLAASLAPLFALSAAEHANLYHGVCPRFGPGGHYERAWQIRRVNCLWCDIDHITPEETAARIKAAASAASNSSLPPLPPPSIAVNSGNGMHLYWLLDDVYLIDDCPDPTPIHTEWVTTASATSANGPSGGRRKLEYFTDDHGDKTLLTAATRPPLSPKAAALQDILSGIAHYLSADHVFDLSRILRLPGSYNRKDERNGKPHILATTVRLQPDTRYPLSAFAPFATLSPEAHDRPRIASIRLKTPLPRLRQTDTDRLSTLINECAAAEVSTRSEVDFHLCCEAVERGWPKASVWELAQSVGKFAERGEPYFDRTWEKAESHTRQKIFDEMRKELQRRKTKEEERKNAEPASTEDAAAGDAADDATPEESAPALDAPAADPAALSRERTLLDRLQLDVLSIHNTIGVKLFSRFNRRVSVVPDISRVTDDHLTMIAGKPATEWLAASTEDADAGKYTLKDVQRALAIVASYVGYTGDKTKGVGCWKLESRNRPPSVVVVGNNEAAIYAPPPSSNGSTHPSPAAGTYALHNHPRCGDLLLNFEQHEDRPWIDLRKLGSLIQQAADPAFTSATLDEAVSLFCLWKWKGKTCPPAMVGLVLATFVQTIWEWRPQVNITGASKSGKSVLFGALADIFHGLAHLTLDATAAGVRDFIGDSATIILHDEFDARTERKHGRQTEILEMIRASGMGGGSLRSSSSRKAHSSRLNHIFWMSGIDFGSDDEADRNRVIAFELLRPSAEIVPPSMHDLRELGQRLLAIAVRHAIPAAALAPSLLRQWAEYARSPQATTTERRVDSRVIQSYAVPAAMLAVCKGYVPLNILRELVMGSIPEEPSIAKDHEMMLSDILAAKVMDLPDHPTVSQLIDKVLTTWAIDGSGRIDGGDSATEAILESNGIAVAKYTPGDVERLVKAHTDKSDGSVAAVNEIAGRGCLAVSHKAVVSHLFRNNRGATGRSVDQILLRAPLAVRSQRKIGGANARCVLVPLLWLYDEFLFSWEGGDSSEENGKANEGAAYSAERAANFQGILFSEAVKSVKGNVFS